MTAQRVPDGVVRVAGVRIAERQQTFARRRLRIGDRECGDQRKNDDQFSHHGPDDSRTTRRGGMMTRRGGSLSSLSRPFNSSSAAFNP